MTRSMPAVVGVTGYTGLLGWHLRCALKAYGVERVRTADRDTFDHLENLSRFVDGCDTIVHLAGLNRGKPDDVEQSNVMLAERLVNALRIQRSTAHVIFSNSTQCDIDTPYGRSKREASDTLRRWSLECEASFTDLILPNVFGEGGRPFWNSAISTFCHQLANGQESRIIEDQEIELLHAQDVSAVIRRCMGDGHNGELRLPGRRISVSNVLQRLRNLSQEYVHGVIPELPSEFDRQLLNTFRSYYFTVQPRFNLALHGDERGVFAEIAKSKGEGQTSYSSTHPGITRGDHFHFRKLERFVVLSGKATIRLRRLFSNEIIALDVDGEQPVAVDMPTLFAHNITNSGPDELLTMFWADEIFDPSTADTFPEAVVL